MFFKMTSSAYCPIQLISCLALQSLMLTAGAQSVDKSRACVVDIAIYDAQGIRLPFHATRVAIMGDNGSRHFDLLSAPVGDLSASARPGGIVLSSTKLVGMRPIEVTLENSGKVVDVEIDVTQCPFRKSMFYGEVTNGLDISSVPVVGQLSGCQFNGDWWVRSIPMFGEAKSTRVFESAVKEDGRFSIMIGAHGVRHMLVVGKGNLPLKVIPMNVRVGRRNDVGVVSLHDVCPE